MVQLFTPIFRAADFTLAPGLAWTGVTLLALGTVLFWRSHADLGRNWSAQIAIQDRHTLVEHGVYRRIRHPMYAALLVSGLGQLLVLQNWIGGSSILIAGMLFVAFRVPTEEHMMIAEFGDAYRDYMRRTGRVFPRLRKLN